MLRIMHNLEDWRENLTPDADGLPDADRDTLAEELRGATLTLLHERQYDYAREYHQSRGIGVLVQHAGEVETTAFAACLTKAHAEIQPLIQSMKADRMRDALAALLPLAEAYYATLPDDGAEQDAAAPALVAARMLVD